MYKVLSDPWTMYTNDVGSSGFNWHIATHEGVAPGHITSSSVRRSGSAFVYTNKAAVWNLRLMKISD